MSSQPASSTTTSPTCDNCKKPQSELRNPLKRCAKCQTGLYCSRDCQKEHWSVHKRVCASRASTSAEPVKGSLSNPTQDEMIEGATWCMKMIDAVIFLPEFDQSSWRNCPSTLRNLFDFARRTWNDYWMKVVNPNVLAEIYGQGENSQVKRRLEVKVPDGRREEWPPFDQETYSDGLSRNWVAAKIVFNDDGKHAMFGGEFDFGLHAREIAKETLNIK